MEKLDIPFRIVCDNKAKKEVFDRDPQLKRYISLMFASHSDDWSDYLTAEFGNEDGSKIEKAWKIAINAPEKAVKEKMVDLKRFFEQFIKEIEQREI